MSLVDPGRILNYDMTTNYFYRASTDRRSEHDEWVRISSKAIEGSRRKTVSPYYKGEDKNCNGLMVPWLECTAASGDLFPMVLLFRLAANEMPNCTEDFLFMKIQGLCVNSQLDVRSEDEIGYAVFHKSGGSMIDFYKWLEDKIIQKHFQLTWEKCYGMTEHDNLSESECARVWSDSDMTNIKYNTDAHNMKDSRLKGLIYAKIGAETTGFMQRLDVGPNFRTKKMFSKRYVKG
jgi:hypothetical protein